MVLSHVVLHATLCNSAMRLKLETAMPLHVTVTDRINHTIVDQTFTAVRENGGVASVSWDMPWGLYKLDTQLRAGRTDCSATTFFAVVNGHNRNISVTVHEGHQPAPVPALIYGAAPFAFGYAQPTVVVFDSKSVKCGGQVPDPLESDFTENDSDGYYATIFPTPNLLQHEPLLTALRLTDSRGNYHYIRVTKDFVTFSGGWPSAGTFNVDENAMDYIAPTQEDTLLCPRLYETITH